MNGHTLLKTAQIILTIGLRAYPPVKGTIWFLQFLIMMSFGKKFPFFIIKINIEMLVSSLFAETMISPGIKDHFYFLTLYLDFTFGTTEGTD